MSNPTIFDFFQVRTSYELHLKSFSNPTIDLHSFQALVTGFEVAFEG